MENPNYNPSPIAKVELTTEDIPVVGKYYPTPLPLMALFPLRTQELNTEVVQVFKVLNVSDDADMALLYPDELVYAQRLINMYVQMQVHEGKLQKSDETAAKIQWAMRYGIELGRRAIVEEMECWHEA